MENTSPKEEIPSCNIDIKRPDQTHITAWRDRAEFLAVYDKIFQSPADDIDTKEDAVRWLNVWKIRLNREIPVCIRCTLVVLEAILFDLRSQRDGRENATETKNIYAGAFTRFINFVTEGQNFRWKKTTIAEHVRGIGIETYLVELRHLCSHRSVSVAIDMFRRSAQYCMDWLKASYWERELSTMQPVTVRTIRSEEPETKLAQLTTTLRTYDVATAGLAMNVSYVALVGNKLKPDELELLQAVAPSNNLRQIADLMVGRLKHHTNLPRTSVGIKAMCDGLLINCRYMLMGPVRLGRAGGPVLGTLHSKLFQYLAFAGYLQSFFERLIAICEDKQETSKVRLAARHWAYRIGMAFQHLAAYKEYCKSLPAEKLVRFDETKKQKMAWKCYRDWFYLKYHDNAINHVQIGYHVDCPWHLKVSEAYLYGRLAAVNSYTKDIIPILLSFVRPALEHRQNIEQLVRTYVGQEELDVFEGAENTGHQETTPGAASKGSDRIYTKEDLDVLRSGTKRRSNGPAGEPEPASKQIKRYGPWSESPDAIAWGSCPLGTYDVPATA